MASKYAKVAGTIPKEPTPRSAEVLKNLEELRGSSISNLTLVYNTVQAELEKANKEVERLDAKLDALKELVREYVESIEGESVTINGYTWSPKPKPFPHVVDRSKMVDYFLKEGQQDLLSVHQKRLESIISEEALAGKLRIDQRTEKDPTTGEERQVTEVWSQIPGVQVYIKPSLSRVKSSKGEK